MTAVTCPLCAHAADSEAALRRHLLIAHQKNTLVDALLETRERDPVPRPVGAHSGE